MTLGQQHQQGGALVARHQRIATRCIGQSLTRFAQLAYEAIERRTAAFRLDQDATGLILDEAAQLQPRRQGVHEAPKPNALHNSLDGNGLAFHPRTPPAGVGGKLVGHLIGACEAGLWSKSHELA